jgi:hypothetical protein
MEAAIMARVRAVGEFANDDPERVRELRTAVTAAVAHGLETLEGNVGGPVNLDGVLARARLAAQAGVPLDGVLRRYFVGYTLFLDFVFTEARRGDRFEGPALQGLLREQNLIHERVISAISEEYEREPRFRAGSTAERRAEMVRLLLEGESLDASSLGYEIEGHYHHAVIARGPGGKGVVQRLGERARCRVLVVVGGPRLTWGWLGSPEAVATSALALDAARFGDGASAIAIGEPAAELTGWRLGHLQARAAMALAMRTSERVVRYVDVALLASITQDELLARSLRVLYLEPIAEDDDGGDAARRTLRAYFRAGRNTSAAAAALGVKRQTVARRLQAVEERLGDVFTHRGADLEAALRLEELSRRDLSIEQPVDAQGSAEFV